MPAIRKAFLHDAKRLAAIAEATFRDTFAAANTPEDMELHCRTSYGEAIQAGEIANPDMVTLLCERNGILVGFAQLRWGKAPGCVLGDAPGEIRRLYVAREFHGHGVVAGEHIFPLGNDPQSDIVMARPVAEIRPGGR